MSIESNLWTDLTLKKRISFRYPFCAYEEEEEKERSLLFGRKLGKEDLKIFLNNFKGELISIGLKGSSKGEDILTR